MCVALVVLLSVSVLHSASAGGAYCSKTAAARAAALGLEYPGHHGAPDLSGPQMIYPRSFNYEVAAADPDWGFYQQAMGYYPGPHFREVKHVAPPAQGSSFGQPELTFWAPRGYSQPHAHVYSKQPLAVDEIGPIGYDMSLGGLGQPRSAGHAVDQSDFADAGFESEVVEPRGFRHLKKLRHLPAAWRFLRGPVQHVFRDFYSQPFVHGKAHVKRM
ncbi:hypothetical protein OJAV_G00162410 [Oryzias javanicus]|uniref:Uncharacterized protein n=1 Tax=Oryzias javanicus TaxID=123683 RepID=A0A3S2PK12_ORYJA|nr:hypothetical protein OJAV_G00162410 [Oryzias javanicus]